MTILVTGGAGYIGSHVVRALQRAGYRAVVLDNLVYGHRRIVEDVLKVPLVVGQVGDRSLLDQLLWVNIHLLLVNRSKLYSILLLMPMLLRVSMIQVVLSEQCWRFANFVRGA